ncbi:MAG: hypothetical protein K1X85_05600 [Ignavibacteria bacterium]|nr:hypothetical protein [Ignavibacteria bacterium]
MAGLKALTHPEDVHTVQATRYTIAYDFTDGLLNSFGGNSAVLRNMFNPKYNMLTG